MESTGVGLAVARYISTYGLGIYLLNNFIGFLSPLSVSFEFDPIRTSGLIRFSESLKQAAKGLSPKLTTLDIQAALTAFCRGMLKF